jgi:hypothetical protein
MHFRLKTQCVAGNSLNMILQLDERLLLCSKTSHILWLISSIHYHRIVVQFTKNIINILLEILIDKPISFNGKIIIIIGIYMDKTSIKEKPIISWTMKGTKNQMICVRNVNDSSISCETLHWNHCYLRYNLLYVWITMKI